MRGIFRGLTVTLCALLMAGCDWLLETDPVENDISHLTKDVEMVAVSATIKHFSGVYAEYPERENFIIELLGTPHGDVTEAMILDLLAPKGSPSAAGTYEVSSKGEYIALPRYAVVDEQTGFIYYGGCYYGQAVKGIIKDYFGFLTEGEVRVAELEDGSYHIEVTAKSGNNTVSVTYDGTPTKVENVKQ